MHFNTKNYLKNNYYPITKHTLYTKREVDWFGLELSFSPNKIMVDNLIEFERGEKKKVRKDMELKLGCV
jgi:hypothetical protein